MKLSYIIFITLSSIFILNGCSSKSAVKKEKFEKTFKYVQLETKKDDALFFIDNQKDIDKINNLYDDVKDLLRNNEFSINYECTFSHKTDEKDYSYFNNTYTRINGDYFLEECVKKDTPLVFDSNKITIENKSIVFDQVLTNEEKLNTYVNFMLFLHNTNIKENQTLTSKYNIAIPFSLNPSSFEQNKLIIDDEFLSKISVKTELLKMLKENDYKVTDDKSQANIIINLENLAFGNNDTTEKKYQDLIIIDSRKSSAYKGGLIKGSSGNLVLDSVALTMNVISTVSFLLDVKDDIKKPVNQLLYTINKCEIIEKAKVQNTYMNTYLRKYYETNILSTSSIDSINELVSSNLVAFRLKHIETEQVN